MHLRQHLRWDYRLPALAVPEDCNTTRETNPKGGHFTYRSSGVHLPTSQAKHWIIVSFSVVASYGLLHLQNKAWKFWPYWFCSLTGSDIVCNEHGWEMPSYIRLDKFPHKPLKYLLLGNRNENDALETYILSNRKGNLENWIYAQFDLFMISMACYRARRAYSTGFRACEAKINGLPGPMWICWNHWVKTLTLITLYGLGGKYTLRTDEGAPLQLPERDCLEKQHIPLEFQRPS